MSVGFIGFGEVGYEISKGLSQAGLLEIYAYDVMQNDSEKGCYIQGKAAVAGVTLLASAKDVVRQCDMILAVVPGAFALKSIQEILDCVDESKYIVDLSTSLPSVKKEEARLVEAKGGHFIDGALMASLSQAHHKVPILVSGSCCAPFIERFTPYGMNITEISANPGDAIAVKFVRSIYMKGLAALGAEMLEAAYVLGVDALVIDSIGDTLDGKSFAFNNNYLVIASAWHGARQVHEMEDVAQMLKHIGVQPTMTKATVQRLEWFRDLNAREYFHEQRPVGCKEMVELWRSARNFDTNA